MESFGSSRMSCFIEEDDGLASLAEMEAGFSGTLHQSFNQNGFFSSSLFRRSMKSSLRNLTSWSASSPRVARFYDARSEDHYHQPHFLDACFLCKKPLGVNKDIFMYRGDTPFCSEECREEQIEMDEAMEKNRNLCSSMKLALRNKDQMKSKSSNKAQDHPVYTGTVAAA